MPRLEATRLSETPQVEYRAIYVVIFERVFPFCCRTAMQTK